MSSENDGSAYVLDSSALIALLHGEPGAAKVEASLDGAVISAVNLGETATKLIRRGGDPKLVERYLRGMPLQIVPWDEALVWESLDLSPLAWTHGLSFADRACLTLARHVDLPALTSDASWKKLEIGVRVVLFRERKS
ncbi:MAG TPA: type II toxin-antitoxin system VapC family toxin [Bryobacteraceae bacterium]